MNIIHNLIVVSRLIKPSDLRLFAEPSHLTLCIAYSISLDYTDHFVLRDTGIDVRNNMSIPYRFKSLRTGWDALSKQLSDFLDKTRLKHLVDTLVDSFIQLLS